MRKVICIVLTLCLVLSAGVALAGQADGVEMVKNLWHMFATGQVDKIAAMTSPAFQSVHSFGANDKAAEMKLLRHLKLGKYRLSGFKVTQQGPVVLVSYFAGAAETIQDDRLGGKATPRLTIFIKTDQGWMWLAHANLKPVEKK